MLIASVIIVLGFLGLIWGADKFVSGASGLARNLGVSPLLIGLTIVAFGTSAPEIFSSAVAAMQKKPELAIGNAFGSNLFNVGIALGIAALIKPLKAPESMLNRELPALLLVTVITGILIADLQLDLLDAILLIMITVFFIYRLLKQQIKSTKASLETPEQESTRMKSLKAVAYLTLGLLILVISAEALVQAASNIAEALGVSASIIGLTIVALGTSLPELAASVTCVLKNQDELAIGNIVGSNILNLLAVLPFPGIFAPGLIEANLFYRDFSIVTFLTILLCFFCYRSIKKEIHIGRVSGIIFLLIYCGWFTVMLNSI
tara:strand:+ start:156 stop:1112 length:957 start_codon:yes stop_codon:yes gene_type:complete